MLRGGIGLAPDLRAAVRELELGRQRLRLGFDQVQVGVRGAAHGLRGVVDQDVQRALGGDAVGQRDDLGRVAQVDADDAQAVDPVRGVLKRGKAACGVAREARGDGGVGTVAQQAQGDVHADLGASAGEQRALAGQVGAGVAAFAAGRGALRAQVVVEGIHGGVALLADVAAARLDVLAGGVLVGGRAQVQAEGLVVQALRGTGGGAFNDGAVGRVDGRSLLVLAVALGGLEHLAGRAAHGNVALVLGLEPVHQAQHLDGCLKLGCGKKFVGTGLIGLRKILSHVAIKSTGRGGAHECQCRTPLRSDILPVVPAAVA